MENHTGIYVEVVSFQVWQKKLLAFGLTSLGRHGVLVQDFAQQGGFCQSRLPVVPRSVLTTMKVFSNTTATLRCRQMARISKRNRTTQSRKSFSNQSGDTQSKHTLAEVFSMCWIWLLACYPLASGFPQHSLQNHVIRRPL